MDDEEVVDHLLAQGTWTATRSSGPGGQRRDKVSTQAELCIDEEALEGLPADIAEQLRAGLGLGAGPLRITSQVERLLSRNREVVRERLLERVAAALAPPPPRRRRSRPTASARAERLDSKRRKGAVKQLRRPPASSD